jgi:GNAT superfamily N-acetyltransferase
MAIPPCPKTMSRLPSPDLLTPSQCPEQHVFLNYDPDFLVRPVVPRADYRKMTTVLDMCNGVRDGVFPENWPREETAEYLYDRLAIDDRWGAIVSAAPLGLMTAGFVIGMPYRDGTTGEVVSGSQDLRLLMVNPLYQRRNLGRFLLDWAADFNQKQGADTLLLWVQAHNERAQKVYKQAGYVATGATRPREGVTMVELCLDLTEPRPKMLNFNANPTDKKFIPLIARPALERLVIPT